MSSKRTRKKEPRSLWRRLAPFIIAGAATIGALLLYWNLSRYDYGDIVDSITRVPYSNLGLAVAWATASYVCLTGFDYLALRYVKRPQPYSFAAFVSFASLSIGHNIGVAFLSSGAIRYRFYSRAGLSAEEVGKLILFCGVTVGLGLMTLAGMSLLLQSEIASGILNLPTSAIHVIGAVCLALSAAYVVLALYVRRPLSIRSFTIEMPEWRLAVAQIVIGSINFLCVAACLHAAVSAFADVPYLAVAVAYTIANVAALISHVPGGLGVIESVLLLLLPGANLIGAVLLFRFVYFLLPLCIGGSLFALSEVWFARRRLHSER